MGYVSLHKSVNYSLKDGSGDFDMHISEEKIIYREQVLIILRLAPLKRNCLMISLQDVILYLYGY